ncbi:hypothetical protein JCM10213_002348 [Rhodosporidiobolus nylandii]
MGDTPAFDFASFRAAQEDQNTAALAASGINQAAADVVAAAKSSSSASTSKAKAPAPRKKAAPKRKSEAVEPAEPRVGTRRSTRGSTMAAGAKDEEEKRRIEAEALAQREREEAEAKAERDRLKHGDRDITAETGVTGSGDTGELLATLKEVAILDESDKDEWELGKSPAPESKKLTSLTEPLELRAIVKVIPDRIYSMTAHPDPQRHLVFSGDKGGHISLWDCTNAGHKLPSANGAIRDAKMAGADEEEEKDDDEEYQWGKWWVWKGHLGSSVSCLKFRPGVKDEIYSCSYDATLRTHHFERGFSEEVIDADQWSDEALLHTFDFDPTGNEIWASDHNGGLIWRDLREAKDKAKRWSIDGHKVGCISLNPANPDMAVSSHLKRAMRLWDLSALRGLPEDTDIDEVVEKACLHEYSYEKACTSAYFDPTGTRLASTCYDDAIRIWDIQPQKMSGYAEGNKWKYSQRILHNCQVGAYVTVLRARWSTASAYPPHLHIGDMARTLDIYSPDSTRSKIFTDESITAVPAVTASHPTVGGMYWGGAASGKVSYWTAPLAEDE